MNSDNAFIRVLYSVMYLSQQLGRIPEYREWNEFYENKGLNRGQEDKDRSERFDNIVKYKGVDFCKKHIDWCKKEYEGEARRLQRLRVQLRRVQGCFPVSRTPYREQPGVPPYNRRER